MVEAHADRLHAPAEGRLADGLDEQVVARRTPWPAPAPDIPEVARARFWLTTTGWRRRGRIDPAEVPG